MQTNISFHAEMIEKSYNYLIVQLKYVPDWPGNSSVRQLSLRLMLHLTPTEFLMEMCPVSQNILHKGMCYF